MYCSHFLITQKKRKRGNKTREKLRNLSLCISVISSAVLCVCELWRKEQRIEKMGRIFLVDLEGRAYRCKYCKTNLALADDLISKVLSFSIYVYPFWFQCPVNIILIFFFILFLQVVLKGLDSECEFFFLDYYKDVRWSSWIKLVLGVSILVQR